MCWLYSMNSPSLPSASLDLDKWIYEPPPESEDDMKDDLGFILEPLPVGEVRGGGRSPPSKGRRKKRSKLEKEEQEEMERVGGV